ncbi:hypothetical protein DUNSADRAFT_17594 [Dunaliella salina]|uniref:Hikeshi-like C-terminal domain-containing protein n=1 Tax=Dunaliella salina TaxID=3046 RepID=A0ABQ7G1H0_DUNSA|nr:hypothetical protein DUNSADRAFT_17594 [Dunaliella salina]|eukprot:KAF5828444.1 hypothetical protein DUNSADRAFT_17594 [Dunaliella salina]
MAAPFVQPVAPAPAVAPPLFGVVFVGKSFPIPEQAWTRIDATHWVLDVCTQVLPTYWELKELTLFLTQPNILDPSLALGLYLKIGNSNEWLYRGCVHQGHPAELVPLQWPSGEQDAVYPAPGAVQIGVSVEPAAEIVNKEGSKLAAREEFAKLVGVDLFRFMESFQKTAVGDHLVVPANALDRWFLRFQEKYRKDPDFLARDKEKL